MREQLRKFILWAAIMVAAMPALHLRGDDTNKLWQVDLGKRIESSPAIGPDGTIYVTACGFINFGDVSGGKLAAVTPDGVTKWIFKTPSEIVSSPALGDDGTVYFGCRDRKFYAIDRSGKKKWSFTTGAWVDSSPAVGTNEVTYFGGWDKKFYALNPDGTKRWEFATGGPIDSSAAIARDGTIYFGSHDKNFYALNPDGTVDGGSFATERRHHFITRRIDGQGMRLYFTPVDGRVYVLNPDGSKKLHFWTGGVRQPSPVLGWEGNIYLGVNDTFECYRLRWDEEVGIRLSPGQRHRGAGCGWHDVLWRN